jgi:HAD superfamily hydrolase (TIGR01549 family)
MMFNQEAVRPLRGVIFDMDGTLTEHGAIDFAAMYTRNGLKRRHGTDILTLISELPTEEQRAAAMQVILEEELLGVERMLLRPYLHDLMESLASADIKIAMTTRNCELAVVKFLDKANLPPTTFVPSLHRDSLGGVNKPDVAVARHILEHWGVPSEDSGSVWFVGDSPDDMLCGRGAGCRTCLIRTPTNGPILANTPHLVDASVENLQELKELLLSSAL